MLKRWFSIKKIEVYLLCEILISKDTLQGQKTVASLLNRIVKSLRTKGKNVTVVERPRVFVWWFLPADCKQSVTFHAWSVTICLPFTPPRHSTFCHVHAIVRIVQWEENSEMKLAYLHLFVPRGRRSNTDNWFLIKEAQNIAVYGDKIWERWNFSGV